jgi:hypothetical protein
MPRWPEIDDSKYLGKRINAWTILASGFRVSGRRAFLCRCDCGRELQISRYRLESRPSQGCDKCYGGHATGKNHPHFKGQLIPQELLGRLKRNAKTRGIEVLVSLDELTNAFNLQGGKCALTGLDLIPSARPNGTASVDRIDSGKPYEPGNIQWVHKDINRMKNKLDERRFIEMCSLVCKHKRNHGRDD